MTKKLLCGLISMIGINGAFAANNVDAVNATISSGSSPESAVTLTKDDIKRLKKIAEMAKLDDYSGVPGTAPKDKTVSATGAALEETQTGPQVFAFWTQTLSSGVYYEGRLYAKYNAATQNPAFPSVPPSAENNPPGYKAVFKLGYNFHVTSDYDITPYLRLEVGKNMSLVYADNTGNYIDSTNYAILPGFKQTFKLTENLIPYIDIYGGINQVSLTGDLTQGANANQTQNGQVQQTQLTTEFGFAYKITDHQAIIPYTQFVYTSNNPDSIAAASYNAGGFNISQLTSSQQVYAIKYSYAF